MKSKINFSWPEFSPKLNEHLNRFSAKTRNSWMKNTRFNSDDLHLWPSFHSIFAIISIAYAYYTMKSYWIALASNIIFPQTFIYIHKQILNKILYICLVYSIWIIKLVHIQQYYNRRSLLATLISHENVHIVFGQVFWTCVEFSNIYAHKYYKCIFSYIFFFLLIFVALFHVYIFCTSLKHALTKAWIARMLRRRLLAQHGATTIEKTVYSRLLSFKH